MEFEEQVCGSPTKFVLLEYSDRMFLSISQLRAFGTLVGRPAPPRLNSRADWPFSRT